MPVRPSSLWYVISKVLISALMMDSAVVAQVSFVYNNEQLKAITVDNINVLTGGGVYLVGSRLGDDTPETNYISVGGSSGRMTNNGPPFRLTFSEKNEYTLTFTAIVGPLKEPVQSLSIAFDFDVSLTHALAFPKHEYRLQCTGKADGPARGSGLMFDHIPQACEIKKANGQHLGNVGALYVDDPAIPWIQFEGKLANVRVVITRGVHVTRFGFVNHFATHSGQVEFGPIQTGQLAILEGHIVVLQKANR